MRFPLLILFHSSVSTPSFRIIYPFSTTANSCLIISYPIHPVQRSTNRPFTHNKLKETYLIHPLSLLKVKTLLKTISRPPSPLSLRHHHHHHHHHHLLLLLLLYLHLITSRCQMYNLLFPFFFLLSCQLYRLSWIRVLSLTSLFFFIRHLLPILSYLLSQSHRL